MDLQLNISTITQTTKRKAQKANKTERFSNKNNSQISFVSKPAFDGKTLARKRKHDPNARQKVNFSLLNAKQNDSTESKQPVKSIPSPVKDKRKDKIKDVEKTVDFPDTPDASFSINTVSDKIPKKHEKQKFSNNEKHEEKKEKKQRRNETENPETRKKSVFAQIHGLFKNNPEIPKIGQRLVKPINEKVFSGKNFENLNIHSFSIANLEKNMGLKQLTVVQQKASPVILEGRDVLVRSQTGSGKTLAYALPIVEALQALRPKLKRHDGVKALVIVPTRELALQTYELFNKLVRPFTWIVPGYLIGGENRKAEKARIRKGFNILIGTPGRLCDHIKHTVSLKLDGTRCLILDEADRLLDMGYEKDVASIVQTLASHKAASGYDPMALVRNAVKKSHIHFGEVNAGSQDEDHHNEEMTKDIEESVQQDVQPKEEPYTHELSNVFLSDKRQTVLLSATLTKAVETLAGLTMENPVFIDASEGRATLIADSLAKPTELKEEIKNEEESESNEETQDADFEIVPLVESDEDNEVGDKESNDEESEESGEEAIDDNDDDEGKSDENDGDDSDESENDDQSDESSADSESDDKKAIDKSKLIAYKGLNAFTGIKADKEDLKKSRKKNKKLSKKKIKESHQDESSDEDTEEKTNENIKLRIPTTVQETSPKKVNKQGSDSDSDYDFFAVAKCPKKKVPEAIPDEEPDFSMETNFVTEIGDHSNPFQNAVQSAIAQDEMIIPSSVTQIYIVAPMKLRLVTLSALIIDRCVKPGNGKMLVFMGTQDLIDYHCDILSKVLAGKTPKKIEPDLKAKNKRDEKKNKRNKLLLKNCDEYETADNDKEVDHEAEEDAEPQVEKKKNKKVIKQEGLRLEGDKMGGKDEEEYNQYEYDGMDLEEYEAKMRAEKAFVNVEFFQLHGSMDQKTRTEVFKTFRAASSGVLLCTDVCARGLDLPHVDCIVQYTGPISATDYVHRVGRTARAGNVGTAIMMLLPSEVLFVRQLEERRIRLHQEDMEEALKALAPLERGPHRGGGLQPAQVAAASLQEAFEELVLKDKELYVKACKAFTSWLRFYSTYPREARAAFDRNALHVGHAARALALRDPPKKIAKAAPRPTNRKESDLKRKAEKTKKSPGSGVRAPSAKSASREKRMLIGEFQSGIEPPKKKSKRNKNI